MITVYNGGCDSKHKTPLEVLYTSSDYLLLFVKTDAFFEVANKKVPAAHQPPCPPIFGGVLLSPCFYCIIIS